jgi:hypothetical protein
MANAPLMIIIIKQPTNRPSTKLRLAMKLSYGSIFIFLYTISKILLRFMNISLKVSYFRLFHIFSYFFDDSMMSWLLLNTSITKPCKDMLSEVMLFLELTNSYVLLWKRWSCRDIPLNLICKYYLYDLKSFKLFKTPLLLFCIIESVCDCIISLRPESKSLYVVSRRYL